MLASFVLPYVRRVTLTLLGFGVFAFGFMALTLGLFTALAWDHIDLYSADGTPVILTAADAVWQGLLFSSLGGAGLYVGTMLMRRGVSGAVGRVARVVVWHSAAPVE
jgi:hypothetical protein